MARLERLHKYQQRHLRDASTLRSRLFLRLLLVIVEKNFDAEHAAEPCYSNYATRSRRAKLLPRSKSFPTNLCGPSELAARGRTGVGFWCLGVLFG